MNKSKLNVWSTLREQATDSLKSEKQKLNGILVQLEHVAKTIEELSKIKVDYHPNRLIESEKSGKIDQIQRNWNFLTNIEQAIRKTNERKLLLKKKESEFLESCRKAEIEVQKYEVLENRALNAFSKEEAVKVSKADDEIAASFWLRQKHK